MQRILIFDNAICYRRKYFLCIEYIPYERTFYHFSSVRNGQIEKYCLCYVRFYMKEKILPLYKNARITIELQKYFRQIYLMLVLSQMQTKQNVTHVLYPNTVVSAFSGCNMFFP